FKADGYREAIFTTMARNRFTSVHAGRTAHRIGCRRPALSACSLAVSCSRSGFHSPSVRAADRRAGRGWGVDQLLPMLFLLLSRPASQPLQVGVLDEGKNMTA